ncbi:hypothetical protein BLNAU_4519 [Blattamonas nauphoetae]|uniref:Uncharacterized protein n=1 Tax=Blattamonas nauphoetae TaxID=2049346 RepID=A0ABQ9YA99_9EUKA|nr:hypothetical protein BLNAU_4519 [Blattamonas nauphoetae]
MIGTCDDSIDILALFNTLFFIINDNFDLPALKKSTNQTAIFSTLLKTSHEETVTTLALLFLSKTMSTEAGMASILFENYTNGSKDHRPFIVQLIKQCFQISSKTFSSRFVTDVNMLSIIKLISSCLGAPETLPDGVVFLEILQAAASSGCAKHFIKNDFLDSFNKTSPLSPYLHHRLVREHLVSILNHTIMSPEVSATDLFPPAVISFLSQELSESTTPSPILQSLHKISKNKTHPHLLFNFSIEPPIVSTITTVFPNFKTPFDKVAAIQILSIAPVTTKLDKNMVSIFLSIIKTSSAYFAAPGDDEDNAERALHETLFGLSVSFLAQHSEHESFPQLLSQSSVIPSICSCLSSPKITSPHLLTKLCFILARLSSIPQNSSFFLDSLLINDQPIVITSFLTSLYIDSKLPPDALIHIASCILSLVSHSPDEVIPLIGEQGMDSIITAISSKLGKDELSLETVSSVSFLFEVLLKAAQHQPRFLMGLVENGFFSSLLTFSEAHIQNPRVDSIVQLALLFLTIVQKDEACMQKVMDLGLVDTALSFIFSLLTSKLGGDTPSSENEENDLIESIHPLLWTVWQMTNNDTFLSKLSSSGENDSKLVLCMSTLLSSLVKMIVNTSGSIDRTKISWKHAVHVDSIVESTSVVILIIKLLSTHSTTFRASLGNNPVFISSLGMVGQLLQHMWTFHSESALLAIQHVFSLLNAVLDAELQSESVGIARVVALLLSPELSLFIKSVLSDTSQTNNHVDQLVVQFLLLVKDHSQLVEQLFDESTVNKLVLKLHASVPLNSNLAILLILMFTCLHSKPNIKSVLESPDTIDHLSIALTDCVVSKDVHTFLFISSLTFVRLLSSNSTFCSSFSSTTVFSRFYDILCTDNVGPAITRSILQTISSLLFTSPPEKTPKPHLRQLVEGPLIPTLCSVLQKTGIDNPDVTNLVLSMLASLSSMGFSQTLVDLNTLKPLTTMCMELVDGLTKSLEQQGQMEQSQLLANSVYQISSIFCSFSLLPSVHQSFITHNSITSLFAVLNIVRIEPIKLLDPANPLLRTIATSSNFSLTTLFNLTLHKGCSLAIISEQTIPDLLLQLSFRYPIYVQDVKTLSAKILSLGIFSNLQTLAVPFVKANAAPIILEQIDEQTERSTTFDSLVNLLSLCLIFPDQKKLIDSKKILLALQDIIKDAQIRDRSFLNSRLLVCFTNLAADLHLNRIILQDESGADTGVIDWLTSLLTTSKGNEDMQSRLVKTCRNLLLEPRNVQIFISRQMIPILVELLKDLSKKPDNIATSISLVINPCVSFSPCQVEFAKAGIVEIIIDLYQTHKSNSLLVTELLKGVVSLTGSEDSLNIVATQAILNISFESLQRSIAQYNPVKTTYSVSDPFFERSLAALMNLSLHRGSIPFMTQPSFIKELSKIIGTWVTSENLTVKNSLGLEIKITDQMKAKPTPDSVLFASGILINIVKESTEPGALHTFNIIPLVITALQYFLTDRTRFDQLPFGNEIVSVCYNLALKPFFKIDLAKSGFVELSLTYLSNVTEFVSDDPSTDTVLRLISSVAHLACDPLCVPSIPQFDDVLAMMIKFKEQASKDYLLAAKFEQNLDHVLDSAIVNMKQHQQEKS